jgi:ComF family protein
VLVARGVRRLVLDLIFPARCIGCGEGSSLLCAACRLALPEAANPRCMRCWRPQAASNTCSSCRAEPPAFDGLRAAFVHTGVARELVRGLKYRGMTALAEPMGSLLAGAMREHRLVVDLVVPVPLSGLRRRTRGYNQAEELARALGRAAGLPVWPKALERTRHTAPQAGSGAEERLRNVAGAFRVRDDEVNGRRVLIVDDVTTTGATLSACSDALKGAGAQAVWALAFTRED